MRGIQPYRVKWPFGGLKMKMAAPQNCPYPRRPRKTQSPGHRHDQRITRYDVNHLQLNLGPLISPVKLY